MKVYLSNYRDHWVSPYTIYEKLVFWRKVDILDLSPREEKFCDMMLPLCNGWQALLNVIHPRVNYVKIDRWDTWDMRSQLAKIVLPMLIQLKATKHGIPGEFLHPKGSSEEIPFEEAEKKWDECLDAMIWSFEQETLDDAEYQFYQNEEWDRKGHQAYCKRKQKGYDLFGKYYLNLWD